MCYLQKIKLKDEVKFMKKKLLVIGATVVLAMTSLTGCGSKDTSGGTTSEEATVSSVADTTEETTAEETTAEEVTTEEICAFDDNAFFSSFKYQGNGFQAYKEGNEFVCGDYTFIQDDINPDVFRCELSETDSLVLTSLVTDEDLFTSNVDSFVSSAPYNYSYERTGDVVEFTNSDGKKVKVFFAKVSENKEDGVSWNSIILAIDNGVSIEVGTHLFSGGVEITQDEFEKFLPLTEGWISNRQ